MSVNASVMRSLRLAAVEIEAPIKPILTVGKSLSSAGKPVLMSNLELYEHVTSVDSNICMLGKGPPSYYAVPYPKQRRS
jgi:hypothetical protein